MKSPAYKSALAVLILFGLVLLLAAQTITWTQVSPDAVPARATFMSMQNVLPPSPFDPFPDLSLFTDGTPDVYWYDDSGVDYSSYLHRGAMDDAPFPGGIIGSNSSSSGSGFPVPNYTLTTNYNEYTNFWLAITNSATDANVSVMNTLPGFSYTVLTNYDLNTASWGEFYTFTATNSISPCPSIPLDTSNLFFKAKLVLGGQSLWVCTNGTNITKEQMVSWLMGTNPVIVTNITITGHMMAIGIFTNAAMVGSMSGYSGLAFDRGVILSTGWVTNVLGPNYNDGENGWEGGDQTQSPSDLAQYGTDYHDPDLAGLVGTNGVNDTIVLEFDLIATNSFQLSFEYIYASEEYPEWIGPFNDPFAIFVSTNYVSGAWQNSITNDIALVPGTNLVVSVNNINGGCTESANTGARVSATNYQYYVDNHGYFDYLDSPPYASADALAPYAAAEPVYNLQCDGFTVPLVAEINIAAGITNHIKIAIGDCTDHLYDSAVFIKAPVPASVSCN